MAYAVISCSWWKDIDIAAKYPFARDQLVEGYLWILGVYFEPQYARARNLMVKMFKLISVVDDIFDVDGTFEDLLVFRDAIQRFELCTLIFPALPSNLRSRLLTLDGAFILHK